MKVVTGKHPFTLLSVTRQITGIVGGVIQKLVGAILTKRLGLTTGPANRIALEDGPFIDEVHLPFFCSAPKEGSR